MPPWSGACEEASIAMVDQFYLGTARIDIGRQRSKDLMFYMFAIEDRLFGSNLDSNATRTQKLINDYTSFDATIVRNPTLDQIKEELTAGHPVISLHYGYDLHNPLHSFRRGGSSYHMMVLTGFDDQKEILYANDPELPGQLDYAYNYATIMASLHDFNHVTKKADGPPTVLFTKPKKLVHGVGRSRIYLVRDGVKYLVSNPTAFKNHHWSWSIVKTISISELDALKTGASINQ